MGLVGRFYRILRFRKLRRFQPTHDPLSATLQLMKFRVQGVSLLLFLTSPLALAFQNFDCVNPDSPFIVEVGFDSAFVLNKDTYEVEKVLLETTQKGFYMSESKDWELKLNSNKSKATLKVGDSDEKVTFECLE